MKLFRKREGYIPLQEMQDRVNKRGQFIWKAKCWRSFL